MTTQNQNWPPSGGSQPLQQSQFAATNSITPTVTAGVVSEALNLSVAAAGANQLKVTNTVVSDGLQSVIPTGSLTEATSSVLTITGGTSALLSNVSVQVKQASATVSGYLSTADWNTFNNKQNALTFGNLTGGGALGVTGGTGAVIGSGVSLSLTTGNVSEATSSVLTLSGNTGAVLGSGLSIQVKQASTSQSGYLSSTDWNTFNGKQAAITTGSTSQYLRGNLTLATLNQSAVAGLTTADTPTFAGLTAQPSAGTAGTAALFGGNAYSGVAVVQAENTSLASSNDGVAYRLTAGSSTGTGTQNVDLVQYKTGAFAVNNYDPAGTVNLSVNQNGLGSVVTGLRLNNTGLVDLPLSALTAKDTRTSTIPGLSGGNITSPSNTVVAGFGAISAIGIGFTRVGNTVSFSGGFTAASQSSGNNQLDIAIPVGSGFTAVWGNAVSTGPLPTIGYVMGGNAGYIRVTIYQSGAVGAAYSIYFSGHMVVA